MEGELKSTDKMLYTQLYCYRSYNLYLSQELITENGTFVRHWGNNNHWSAWKQVTPIYEI